MVQTHYTVLPDQGNARDAALRGLTGVSERAPCRHKRKEDA